MLHAQLVIRADDRAFEKTPNVLNGIGVNVAVYPLFFAMVHRLMSRIGIAYTSIKNRLDHEIDRQEPLPERQVGIVEDRSARHRKLIAAGVAIVLIALDNVRNALARAARALHAVRPAQRDEMFAATFFAAEFFDQTH